MRPREALKRQELGTCQQLFPNDEHCLNFLFKYLLMASASQHEPTPGSSTKLTPPPEKLLHIPAITHE